MSEPFIPSWAEKTLATKKTAFDVAHYNALGDFYEAWEKMHSLPNDRLHKRELNEAAEDLVRKAHLLRRMREARPINGANNGS